MIVFSFDLLFKSWSPYHFSFIFFSLLFSLDQGFETHILGIIKLPFDYFIVLRFKVLGFDFFYIGGLTIKEFFKICSYYSLIKLLTGFILFHDIISVFSWGFLFYFYRQNNPIALTIFYLSRTRFETSVEKSSFDRNCQLEASPSRVEGGIIVVSVIKFLMNWGVSIPADALCHLIFFLMMSEGKIGEAGVCFAIE